MRRGITIGVLSLALLAGSLHAEDGMSSGGGWASSGIYVGLFDFSRLNATLAARQLGPLDQYHYMWGGGGLAEANNISLGGYTYGGSQTVANDELQLKVDYGGWMIELGWMPIATSHLAIGPAVGLGSSGFDISQSSSDTLAPGFEELLGGDSKSWTISNNRFSVAPTLNVVIPISWFGIGLKLGYIWSPFDADWTLVPGGKRLKTNPDLRSSAFFGALQIMLGGKAKSEAGAP